MTAPATVHAFDIRADGTAEAIADIDAPLRAGAASGRLGVNACGLPGATWSPAFLVARRIRAGLAGGLALWFKRRGWL